MSQLKISERVVGDVTILDLHGRIVFGEESDLLRTTIRRVLEGGAHKVLMNMGAVSYIDSGGNGTMAAVNTDMHRRGGNLKLSNLTNKVLEVFTVSKLLAIYDVFDTEASALKSFQSSPLRCRCPVCGCPSGPPLVDGVSWPPQTCSSPGCHSRFTVAFTQTLQEEVAVKNVLIQTYKDEYFQILPGRPFVLEIVGRLDLFASSALKRAWQSLPAPQKVLVDMRLATEIDEAGRGALLGFLAKVEKGAEVVISLEGLDSQQMDSFPAVPPFYENKSAALAALEDLSDVTIWTVKVLDE